MSSVATTYSVSINQSIIDKPDRSAPVDFARGWEAAEPSESELIGHIRQGHAWAPQYKGGHRKTPNFIRSNFLAADVDRGLTLDEAKDHAFVRHHASLIHTTVSHTPESHRLRIIFPLGHPITVAQDWADAQLGLALSLGADPSVSDGARMFFGNTGAIVHSLGGNMPANVLADLILRGRDARVSRSPLDGRVLAVDSAKRIAGAKLIKVAGGERIRMDEVRLNTGVHCPYHDDADPSAFTVRSQRGQIGIYCSACKFTFWPTSDRDAYDFEAFDRMCEALRVEETQDEAEGLERFFPPEPETFRYQQAFLPAFPYGPGITMVKSAKGSGKTEALKSLLADIRAGRYRPGIARKERINSVLLVGHRQSLIREAAAKLGLRCYLDGEAEDGEMRTLAVCLDSLPKYNESQAGRPKPKPFDLVIIDESEQVLAHLLSETIERRYGVERCFDALMHEVSNAKAVIALDADLGLVTAHAMRTMRPQDWASRCRIIRNAPLVPTQKRVMRLHENRKFLELEVIEAIRRGERCFITSNSKKFIDTAHRMISNECGEDIVIRVITSDNSRDDPTVRFIQDIKTEILKVQVVLASPSIGTGIDITFPNGECRVDRVFGFFFSFVNTHTDIDQQLCRVRNPGSVEVWISPTRFEFTSNVDVVMDDIARAYMVRRAVKRRRPDGMVEYDRDDPLLMICAHVTALQRASKNRLVELFCELREQNGWSIERVAQKADSSAFNLAKEMLAVERAERLLNAQSLADADFMELEVRALKGAGLTDDERIDYEKNHFERTVGVTLDRELIDMNHDGRLVDRIEALADIVSVWSKKYLDDSIGVRLSASSDTRGRLQQAKPPVLVAVLLRAAGLTDAEGFKAGRTVTAADLAGFAALCLENRTMIEETLAEPIRSDLEGNPVRQLNRTLGRIGLRLKWVKTDKTGGKKTRFYALPPGLLNRMVALARSYIEVRKRKVATAAEPSL
jgi:hypothetical protein